MTVKVGESGKIFRVAASFDMSSNTELTLTFTKPDETTFTKTKTGGEVVLGTSNITDPDLGSLLANEYVEYTVEPGVFDVAGGSTDTNPWKVYLTYTNTTPDPDDVFIGDCKAFTVEATC